MTKYLIVVEKTGTGYSAFSPDLPGCVATGTTREEGLDVPAPHSYSTYCELPA